MRSGVPKSDSYGPHRLQRCGPWGGTVIGNADVTIGTATDAAKFVTDATGTATNVTDATGTATDVTDATGTATDVTDATGAVIGNATSASNGSDWRSAYYVLRRISSRSGALGGSPTAI